MTDITISVGAPIIVKRADLQSLINNAVHYGALLALNTSDMEQKDTARQMASDALSVHNAVELGSANVRFKRMYKELAEALVGGCAVDELDQEELMTRASNCFYGRTRMNNEEGHLNVGDSTFEAWYATYYARPSNTPKQNAREAYEAGMNDPITMIPSPTIARVQAWMNAVEETINSSDTRGLYDVKQEMYETCFGKPFDEQPANDPNIDHTGELTGIAGMSIATGTLGEQIMNIRKQVLADLTAAAVAHKSNWS